MDKIVLYVGSRRTTSSGMPVDHTRPVQFEGKKIAQTTDYAGSTSGHDDRGVTETLYQVSDGRYVVHIENWSRWQGEATTLKLVKATADDLNVSGRFEHLGRKAGFARPLTLDEALHETIGDFIED